MSAPPKDKAGSARSSLRRYASILRSVAGSDQTSHEIAATHGMHSTTALQVMWCMHTLELIRISDWRRQRRAGATPVWSFSDGDDAPRPLTKEGRPHRKSRRPRMISEVVAFASLIRELEEPRTYYQLRDRTGMHYSTVRRTVNFMVDIGLVYAADWQRRVGSAGSAAMFKIGVGKKSVPRPPPLPSAEVSRRYRDRLRCSSAMTHIVGTLAANEPIKQRA